MTRIPALESMEPSIKTLRRRTKTDNRPSIDELYRKARAVAFYLEHGDRETRAMAELIGYRMIFESMVACLHDSMRGAIPRFVDQIQQSEKTFEEILS